jgi:hypothetical protein
MKRLLKFAAAFIVLIVLVLGIGVWYVLRNIDAIAKDQIERGGTQALGVTTKVDSVSIHLFAGDLALNGLDIANPAGYQGKHFLDLKHGEVAVSLGTLSQPTIEVPRFTLQGLDLSIEENASGRNYQHILDSVQKLKGSSPSTPSNTPEKKLIIKDLLIENVAIHVDTKGMTGLVGQVANPAPITLPIERIELHDVGKTGTGVGGTGVTVGQLSSIIVQAVMAAAVEKGQGMIPDIILKDIQSRVGALGDLAAIPVQVIGKVGEQATEIGKQALEGVGKAASDVGKGVGKAVDDATKKIGGAIGDLIPGGKKDDKKP